MPTLEKLKSYLPKEVIVEIDESNSSIRSLRLPGFLESPQSTLFRLVKEAYYREILKGTKLEDLPALELGVTPSELRLGGDQVPPAFDVKNFLRHWVNPGFSWRNQDTYVVRQDLVYLYDHMHLGLSFGRFRRPDLKDEVQLWLSQGGESILDQSNEELWNYLKGSPLPTKLRERLHLFVETDSIVKEEFKTSPPPEGKIVLVSRDLRLAADLVRLGYAMGRTYQVYALRPAFYLMGRMDEIGFEPIKVIEDQGAMLFEDVVLFSEGTAPDWVWESMDTQQIHRYRGVWIIDRVRARAREKQEKANHSSNFNQGGDLLQEQVFTFNGETKSRVEEVAEQPLIEF